MKYKPQGIYWPPAQGGRGGGRRKYFLSRAPRSFSHTRFARRCFRKERKEKKITSVYRLDCYFNQHYQHRTNQKLHSCANAVLQNRGVCGQAFPCLPHSPVIPLFFALVPFSRRTRAETLSTQARLWGTKDDRVRSIFSHVKITWHFLKFSRVKISCFRVKAHMVFLWYLCNKCYSIYIKTNGRFEIREDPRSPPLCF